MGCYKCLKIIYIGFYKVVLGREKLNVICNDVIIVVVHEVV